MGTSVSPCPLPPAPRGLPPPPPPPALPASPRPSANVGAVLLPTPGKFGKLDDSASELASSSNPNASAVL